MKSRSRKNQKQKLVHIDPVTDFWPYDGALGARCEAWGRKERNRKHYLLYIIFAFYN